MNQPPPPLPRPNSTTTPGQPPPLAYATPVPPLGARRVFDVGMFGWSAAFLGVWVLLVLVVVPNVYESFRDFKVRLPFAARLMLNIWSAIRTGMWVLVVPGVPVLLGFLAAPFGPRGRRVMRIVLTVAFAGLVVFSILSLLLPMMTLISGMSSKR